MLEERKGQKKKKKKGKLTPLKSIKNHIYISHVLGHLSTY
jgi:hypothetical protein